MADNTYKETISKDSRRQIPKNLRQIGKINDGLRIYVEDYVKTFIRQLAETEPEGVTAAVLVGEYVKNEQERYVFIYGAIKLINIYEEDAIIFTEDTWTSIYETIKHYFPEGEIAGWYIRKNEWTERNYDLIKEVHLDNFAGRDKVLLQYDILEKDGEFYCFENGMLVPQSGYFIYYDKNEEMQDYMIDNKQSKREEENIGDHAVREFRAIYQEKHSVEKKDQKQTVVKLMYAAGAVLVMVVMAVGVTAMNNYEKMKGLEETLQTISNSLLTESQDITPTKGPGGIFDDINKNESLDSNDKDDSILKNADAPADDAEDVSIEGSGGDSTESSNKEEGKSNNSENSNITSGNSSTENNSAAKENAENSTETGNKSDNTANSNGDEGNGNETGANPGNENGDDESSNTQPGQNVNVTPVPSAAETPVSSESELTENDPTNTPVPEEGQEALKPLFTADQLTAYIVVQGDTLAGICYKLYGNTNQMKIIQELNQIANENKIYIGQELIVPR